MTYKVYLVIICCRLVILGDGELTTENQEGEGSVQDRPEALKGVRPKNLRSVFSLHRNHSPEGTEQSAFVECIRRYQTTLAGIEGGDDELQALNEDPEDLLSFLRLPRPTRP